MKTLCALLLLAGCSADAITTSPLITARPYAANLNVPHGYDSSKATPLVLLLHGYGATGFLEDAVYGMTAISEEHGFLYAYPDGTIDSTGAHFWNATDACCDLDHSGVDDVAWLNAVIDDIEKRYNVDKKRVFITGHSNGGFMSHRMACDSSPRLAAIVSLAGATWLDQTKCPAVDPISVLEVHGDADTEVLYNGTSAYPSAPVTVGDWATKNKCPGALAPTGMTLDLDSNLPGAETSVQAYSGCPAGSAAELWTIAGGPHVPSFNQPAWGEDVWAWMTAHPKP